MQNFRDLTTGKAAKVSPYCKFVLLVEHLFDNLLMQSQLQADFVAHMINKHVTVHLKLSPQLYRGAQPCPHVNRHRHKEKFNRKAKHNRPHQPFNFCEITDRGRSKLLLIKLPWWKNTKIVGQSVITFNFNLVNALWLKHCTA